MRTLPGRTPGPTICRITCWGMKIVLFCSQGKICDWDKRAAPYEKTNRKRVSYIYNKMEHGSFVLGQDLALPGMITAYTGRPKQTLWIVEHAESRFRSFCSAILQPGWGNYPAQMWTINTRGTLNNLCDNCVQTIITEKLSSWIFRQRVTGLVKFKSAKILSVTISTNTQKKWIRLVKHVAVQLFLFLLCCEKLQRSNTVYITCTSVRLSSTVPNVLLQDCFLASCTWASTDVQLV